MRSASITSASRPSTPKARANGCCLNRFTIPHSDRIVFLAPPKTEVSKDKWRSMKRSDRTKPVRQVRWIVMTREGGSGMCRRCGGDGRAVVWGVVKGISGIWFPAAPPGGSGSRGLTVGSANGVRPRGTVRKDLDKIMKRWSPAAHDGDWRRARLWKVGEIDWGTSDRLGLFYQYLPNSHK